MTKTRAVLAVLLFLLFAFPSAVMAYEVKTAQTIHVDQEETIEGTLYAGGNIITIDGTVNGDVICAGQSISVNGTVNGDVICAGQTVNLGGTINGSARVAGNTININSEVLGGVQAFGATIILDSSATVKRDMLVAGAVGVTRGFIGGDLHGAIANIVIDGLIDGDVKLRLDSRIKGTRIGVSTDSDSPLVVTQNSTIKGDLYYTSGIEGEIKNGASIEGEVGHTFLEKKEASEYSMFWAWMSLFSVFAALVVGLVIISLFGEKIKKLIKNMREKPGLSIGYGAIIIFLTPIISFILLITIIGLPLAGILMALWFISLYVGKIITAIMVGEYLFTKLLKKKRYSLIWSMIIGVVVSWLVYSIPVFGWLLGLIAIWWGIGGVWIFIRSSK